MQSKEGSSGTHGVTQASGSGSPRIASVDGLRAIAVVAVVLFHGFPALVTGGYIGVDVFFVISGFVIALRYFDEMAAGETSFATFFLRRIRRLVPAYALMILIVTAVSTWLLRPQQLVDFSESLLSQAAYVQNVAFWHIGDYFDGALAKPLLHTWSLAVEEQFYLLFPLAILVARWNRRMAYVLIAVAAIGSLLLGMKIGAISPKTSFYWLPFQIWEFAAGILAAALFLRRDAPIPSRILSTTLMVSGLAAILFSIVRYDANEIFVGEQAIVAVAGAVAICLGQRSASSWATAPLTNRVAQHFGRISYSWYLWHWPLLSFYFVVTGRAADWSVGIAITLVGYLLAVVSWRYVERWGTKSGWLRRPRHAIGLLAGFLLFAAGTGAILSASDGFVSRFPAHDWPLLSAQMDVASYRCPLSRRLAMWRQEVCRLGDRTDGDGVLIMGDSHADRDKQVIVDLGDAAGVPVYLVKQNCRITDYGTRSNCPLSQWSQLSRDIARDHITKLVAISLWDTQWDQAKFTQAMERVSRLGLHLYIETATPDGEMFDPGRRIGQAGPIADASGFSLADQLARRHDQRAAIKAYADTHPWVTMLDPVPIFCGSGQCAFARDGVPLYRDTHHLTTAGSRLLTPMYATVFAPGR